MHETVYLAGRGAGGGWAEMVAELRASWELTCRLFYRDFSARYRQSLLGYFWALLPTLLTTLSFTWLTRSQVLTAGETPLPYPLFVLLNLTVWQLFAGGVLAATQSLVAAGGLITKINFARETLVLAAVGQAVFELLIRAVLLAAAFALFRTAPHPGILLLPLVLLPLLLLTLGVGFLLALANGVMRDIGQAVTVVLTFGMLITPVAYPAPREGVLAAINHWNPVAPFLQAAQDLAAHGTLTQPGSLGAASLVSIVVLLTGWRLFHVTETRIAERV